MRAAAALATAAGSRMALCPIILIGEIRKFGNGGTAEAGSPRNCVAGSSLFRDTDDMRIATGLCVVALLSPAAGRAQAVAPQDAVQYVGQTATVCGVVASARY